MNKNIKLWAITLVIAGLVITSTSAIATIETETEYTQECAVQLLQPLNYQKLAGSSNPAVLDGSVPVFMSENDDLHPSLATAAGGVGFYTMIDVFYEDVLATQPTLFHSTDGVTWEYVVTFLYDDAQYSDFEASQDGTWGTFSASPYESGLVSVIHAEFYEDSMVWDWSDNGFDNLQYFSFAAYDDTDPTITVDWGKVSFTGDFDDDGDSYSGVPLIMYQEKGPNQYGIISWISSGGILEGYVHSATDIDTVTLYGYSIYDNIDGTLLIRIDNMGVWSDSGQGYFRHPMLTTRSLDYDGADLIYPDIAAYNDCVIAVAEKVGMGEIVCYYSHDGFLTHSSAVDVCEGSYPAITMIGENLAVMTFVEDNVLYFTVTEDGGATWSTPAQVADNQVESEYRTAEICSISGQPKAIWEDIRNGPVDIYFGDIDYTVQVPILDVEIQSGFGIGAKATVSNIGTADATDVNVTMTVTGGILGGIDVTKYESIATLAPEGSQTVSSGLMIGLGSIVIEVTASVVGADTVSKTKNGNQFLIFTIV